jgi:hypothetical protein
MVGRKVEKFKNPAIFWQPVETYCPNMAISEKNIPQNLVSESLSASVQFINDELKEERASVE